MSGCEWKEFHLSWWNESCSGFARERSAGQALGGMKKRSPLGSGEGEASLALCWHSRAQAGPGHVVFLTGVDLCQLPTRTVTSLGERPSL